MKSKAVHLADEIEAWETGGVATNILFVALRATLGGICLGCVGLIDERDYFVVQELRSINLFGMSPRAYAPAD
jgi:hypothetical protein